MNGGDSIYQFKIEGLTGGEIDFSSFAGKKMLIVNTASECGSTPQYAQLQELYEKFSDKLVVIGVPSNDFGGQEPGNNEEIASFCERNYGVSFPMTTKVAIKDEQARHPLYKWLTDKLLNGVADTKVQWNFYKFLINEDGRLVAAFPSNVEPADEAVMSLL